MAIGVGILIAILLMLGALWGGPEYFYGYVIKRKAPFPDTPAYRELQKKRAREDPQPWFASQPYETIRIQSQDGLNLNGCFLSAFGGGRPENANAVGNRICADTVILAHGYSGDAFQVSPFARFFYEKLGYNVLLVDARGHGASGGDYIGFGWHERLDMLRWMDWVKNRTGPASGGAPVRIVLFGVSMGAATVLMTGGEAPPPELKAIIEDCGYTSAEEELWHLLITLYHLKIRWLLDATSRLTKTRAGFSFAEASSINQVKKITVPTLFIHGDKDTFVPFRMVKPLYEACPAPKELYVAKDAGHGMAYSVAGLEYEERIAGFLKQWVS
jgi:fermentation-respiration switch protein FrsA (DUF1100 family)